MKKLTAFLPKIRNKTRISVLATSTVYFNDNSNQKIRFKNELKIIQFVKEKVKLSLFTADMLFFTEKSQRIQRNTMRTKMYIEHMY